MIPVLTLLLMLQDYNIPFAPRAAAGGPTCSGGSWSESFDPTGYDLFSEQNTDGGCTQDEDDTTRTETYFAGQDYYSHCGSHSKSAYASYDYTGFDPNFMAASVYVTSLTQGNSERVTMFSIGRQFSAVSYVCAGLWTTSGGVDQLEFSYGDNCRTGTGTQLADVRNLIEDNVYIIELEFDENGANDTVGWRVWDCGSNGDSCSATPDQTFSTTASVWTGSLDRSYIGLRPQASGHGPASFYLGFVEAGTSEVCN